MPQFRRKLVRDKIPERVAREGKVARTTIIRRKYLPRHLALKVWEEALELIEAYATGDPAKIEEEAGDVQEALDAFLEAMGVPLEQIWRARLRKARTHGRFKKGIMLLAIEEQEKKGE